MLAFRTDLLGFEEACKLALPHLTDEIIEGPWVEAKASFRGFSDSTATGHS